MNLQECICIHSVNFWSHSNLPTGLTIEACYWQLNVTLVYLHTFWILNILIGSFESFWWVKKSNKWRLSICVCVCFLWVSPAWFQGFGDRFRHMDWSGPPQGMSCQLQMTSGCMMNSSTQRFLTSLESPSQEQFWQEALPDALYEQQRVFERRAPRHRYKQEYQPSASRALLNWMEFAHGP